jgi:hypothetical protein
MAKIRIIANQKSRRLRNGLVARFVDLLIYKCYKIEVFATETQKNIAQRFAGKKPHDWIKN